MPNEDGFFFFNGGRGNRLYRKRKAAGSALLAAAHNMTSPDAIPIRNVSGALPWYSSFDTFAKRSID